MKQINTELLHEDLTFQIRGAIFEVANKYGKGFKESIYQAALAEEFARRNIPYEPQKRIMVYSLDTGKPLGYYIPDFVVFGKILIEIKATDFTTNQNIEQELSYLRISEYEIGILVNFNSLKLDIQRLIFTNERKSFLKKILH